jgi:AcrR family transcriptional regulator
VRDAVLKAAAELALAGGPGAATIDAIAKRAAVSRTTIYRWWPSSAAIVLEGLLESTVGSIIRPAGSTAREAVEHHVRSLNAIMSDGGTGPLVRRVISAAYADREVGRALLDQWLMPRRAALIAVLGDAAARGELRGDADPEVVVDALVSPAYYRLVFGLPALDDAALTALLDTVWQGCAAEV